MFPAKLNKIGGDISAAAGHLDALVQGSVNQQTILNELGGALLQGVATEQTILSRVGDSLIAAAANQQSILSKHYEAFLGAAAQQEATISNYSAAALQASAHQQELLGVLVELARSQATTLYAIATGQRELIRKLDKALGSREEQPRPFARKLERDGYAIVRGFIDSDTTRNLRDLVDEVYELMERAGSFDGLDVHFERNYREWYGVWLQELPAFLAKTSPDLAGRFDRLVETIETGTYERLGDEWIYYPGRSYFRRHIGTAKQVPWHIDADAAALARSDCVNVWLPIESVGRDLPTLEIVPQSHVQMRALPHLTEEQKWRDDAFVDSIGPSKLPQLDPGDALIFDQYVLHRTQLVGSTNMVRNACEFRFTR